MLAFCQCFLAPLRGVRAAGTVNDNTRIFRQVPCGKGGPQAVFFITQVADHTDIELPRFRPGAAAHGRLRRRLTKGNQFIAE